MSKTWNKNVQFPTDSDFVIRITGASFGPSKSSGNPMITAEWEIVSPSEKEIGGEAYEMAGIASNPMSHLYYGTKTVGDEEKSANQKDRLCSSSVETPGFLRLAFPDKPEYADNFNPDNPDAEMLKALEGLCFFAQMSPDTVQERKNPTQAQIEEAKAKGIRAEGDVMKHPLTGKPLVSYRPKVRNIFGLAPSAVGAGKPF